jgi:hypothetical protein
MNSRGTSKNLIAAQMGNTNALRHGVHSARFIEARSSEIEGQLAQQFDFSLAELVALREMARLVALLDAIDADLDERGLTDRKGNPRYLVDRRLRFSRQLDQWLTKISPAIERQIAASQERPAAQRADYIRELERIALGGDTGASAHDRLGALKELLQLVGQAETEGTSEQPVHEEIVVLDLPAGSEEKRVLVRHRGREVGA